jgi:hypothetical protein
VGGGGEGGGRSMGAWQAAGGAGEHTQRRGARQAAGKLEGECGDGRWRCGGWEKGRVPQGVGEGAVEINKERDGGFSPF